MPTFLLYSLKAAGCLAVFYLFLQVVVEPRYAASDEQGVVVRSVAAVVFCCLCA